MKSQYLIILWIIFALIPQRGTAQSDIENATTKKALILLGFDPTSAKPSLEEIKASFYKQMNLAVQASEGKKSQNIDGILDAYRVLNSSTFQVSKAQLTDIQNEIESAIDSHFPRNVESISMPYYDQLGIEFKNEIAKNPGRSYLESSLEAIKNASKSLGTEVSETMRVVTEAVFVAEYWAAFCKDFASLQYATEVILTKNKKFLLPRYLSYGLGLLPKNSWSKVATPSELIDLFKNSTLINHAIGVPAYFSPTTKQNSLAWFLEMQTGNSDYGTQFRFLERLKKSNYEEWKSLTSFIIDTIDVRLVDQFMKEQFKKTKVELHADMYLVNDITALKATIQSEPELNAKLTSIVGSRILQTNVRPHGYGKFGGGKLSISGPLQRAIRQGRVPTATALAHAFKNDPDLQVLVKILPISERIKTFIISCSNLFRTKP